MLSDEEKRTIKENMKRAYEHLGCTNVEIRLEESEDGYIAYSKITLPYPPTFIRLNMDVAAKLTEDQE